MTQPLVTCLCLTRNRPTWLPQAIRCFELQTYANRELLILADGEEVKHLIPSDPRIRYFRSTAGSVIGEKRNLGVQMAQGEIIAHWDDDDYSAPERLEDQIGRLTGSGKSVTGYRTMRFTDGFRWWLYGGDAITALGTSLCYRRDWGLDHPFPVVQIGEDNLFVSAAARAKQLITAESLEFMHATIHPGNTSPRKTDSPNWKKLEIPAA